MALKKIEHRAAKGQFLSLDELAAFVQEAMRSGACGDEVVQAAVSFGGKLQRLAVDVPVTTDAVRLDKEV